MITHCPFCNSKLISDGGEFTATGDEFRFKVSCGGEPNILIEPPESGLSKVLDFYNNYKASKLFI
jgi:hypothetical protein